MSIGVYDSGLGGLSVWRELVKLDVPLVYFGDTAHAPYGEKTSEQLQGYLHQVLTFFTEKGCSGVVVACNTASILALPAVQTTSSIPILGIVDAAIESVLGSKGSRIGILATQATIESGVYQKKLQDLKPELEIFAQSAPRLVPLLEKGETDGAIFRQAIHEYLAPLMAKNIDTLLLGCTHYPFLQEFIREEVGTGVNIVDPALVLQTQVQQWLGELALVPMPSPKHEFWVSANSWRFQQVAQNLLQKEIPPVNLRLPPGENNL